MRGIEKMSTVLEQMLSKYEVNSDYEQAKEDVLPFIKDPSKLDLWSADFFKQITQSLQK